MKRLNLLTIISAVVLMAFSVPALASKSDNRIESSAKESYVFKTYLQGDDIKVTSKDGVVVLKGTVSQESHKSLAQDTVADLPGVKSVDNQLEIKGETSDKASDAWLVTKVKSTFLFHRSVSAKTDVDVKDGIVTLRGEADSQAQKDLTTEYAKDVEGVTGVNNEMIVTAPAKKTKKIGDKIDDASITAQVKMTLLYHRSTSGLKTSVNTKNGVVTLTGKADSSAERDLATKYATDVKGVNGVNNRMTIE